MAARLELGQYEGERRTFRGRFERLGKKRCEGRESPTVLLRDIIDVQTGWLVTDHLWLNLTKGFAELNLQCGDVVQFNARISLYERGRANQKRKKTASKNRDWGLVRPTKVSRYNPQEDGCLIEHAGRLFLLAFPASGISAVQERVERLRKLEEEAWRRKAEEEAPPEMRGPRLSELIKDGTPLTPAATKAAFLEEFRKRLPALCDAYGIGRERALTIAARVAKAKDWQAADYWKAQAELERRFELIQRSEEKALQPAKPKKKTKKKKKKAKGNATASEQ